MLKEIKKAFTLAEVLIVIGIIGVVAALTLPNLNHATGDKETVTRLQKAHSILAEANDRAVAIYGPISTWKSNEQCADNFSACWMKRIGEFLKISKYCDDTVDDDSYIPCGSDTLGKGEMPFDNIIYQLPDGVTVGAAESDIECNNRGGNSGLVVQDICIGALGVDINGPDKGKNMYGYDIFVLKVSDSIGVFVPRGSEPGELVCIEEGPNFYLDQCAFWVIDYGNLDYLKVDESGKCPNSNIILDGITNTSCH